MFRSVRWRGTRLVATGCRHTGLVPDLWEQCPGNGTLSHCHTVSALGHPDTQRIGSNWLTLLKRLSETIPKKSYFGRNVNLIMVH